MKMERRGHKRGQTKCNDCTLNWGVGCPISNPQYPSKEKGSPFVAQLGLHCGILHMDFSSLVGPRLIFALQFTFMLPNTPFTFLFYFLNL